MIPRARPFWSVALLILSLAGTESPAASRKTSHVRGLRCNGHYDDVPLALPWPPSGPRVLWRRHIADGLSGIVVSGNRAFSQVQTLAGQFVVALDTRSGRELWRNRYNWPWQPDGAWAGPYGTPTYSDGRVFFTDCHGQAGCMDANNGRLIWQIDLTKLPGAELPPFGYAATTLLNSGLVLLPVGGTNSAVVALRARDGTLAWHSGTAAAGYSSCTLLWQSGHRQIATMLEGTAFGMDPATGRILWHHQWPAESVPHAGWPLHEDSLLLFSLPFTKGTQTLRLPHPLHADQQLSVAWSQSSPSMDILPGVIINGHLYASDLRDPETRTEGGTRARFLCLELSSGRQQWESELPGHASAFACGDHLLLLNERGCLIVAEANTSNYLELARWQLFDQQRCWSPPAISDGLFIARSGSEFVCLDLAPADGFDTHTPHHIQPGSASHLGNSPGPTAWQAQFYSRAFYAPSAADQARWCTASFLGAILPAWLLAFLLRNRLRFPGVTMPAIAISLGLASTWLLSNALQQWVFTWPAALFGGLQFLALCRHRTLHSPSPLKRWGSRTALALFCAGCWAFWIECRAASFVAGTGYLVGLLPALPLCLIAAAPRDSQPSHQPRLLWLAAAAVHLVASAAFVAWRT